MPSIQQYTSTILRGVSDASDPTDSVNLGQLIARVPAGIICMWSGTLLNIPAGWSLCDGQNGTPDLRSRFIQGAAAGNNPGDTGGAVSQNFTPLGVNASESSHTHGAGTFAIPNHTSVATKQGAAAGNVVTTNTHTISGSSAAGSAHTHTFTGATGIIPTVPPYYTLAFIIKI